MNWLPKAAVAGTVLATVFLGCSPAAARGGVPQPSWAPHGNLVSTFHDGFTGTGLDSSAWETGFNCGLGNSCVSPPVNSLEQNCYDSANVTQPGDGYLHMALTNTPSVCGQSEPYTGSFLDSKLAFSQLGGSWEARIYLPAAGGQVAAWPAFWPTNSGNGDEVDVIEGLPAGDLGLAGDTVAHTHFYVNGQLTSYRCPSVSPLTGWHRFGVSLSNGEATFYYDSTALCTVPMGNTAPLHITFDNAIQADSVTPATWPDVMLIDWVRAWE